MNLGGANKHSSSSMTHISFKSNLKEQDFVQQSFSEFVSRASSEVFDLKVLLFSWQYLMEKDIVALADVFTYLE